MSNCLIATTKGHDELYEENISVVTENRFYSTNLDLMGKTFKIM